MSNLGQAPSPTRRAAAVDRDGPPGLGLASTFAGAVDAVGTDAGNLTIESVVGCSPAAVEP